MRVPFDLPLLPGLRWAGKLRVLSREADGRYAVAFDAEDARADLQERFVYDRAILTAKQLKDWTGFSSDGEALHVKVLPDDATCDVHDWPTAGMPQRLVVALRARHGKGGVNACRDCLKRAHAESLRERGLPPQEP